eukprot:TRINITY_DN774_c0_g1_i1.p1 TRINITY_DN774_c0_g1~~TRINITY_DN774_c0_g1_i1.p1  ORF type:complete len:489 (+),score=65.95 TRINITY_DN774_c0_g1_i1:48-1514(+)
MESTVDNSYTKIAAEAALLQELRLQRRQLRQAYSVAKHEKRHRIESISSIVQYVLDHAENDPFSIKDGQTNESEEGTLRNPFRESLTSSRIFNPFSAKTKEIAKYSGKTRHELFVEQKASKEIDDWLKKLKKRRMIAAMDPFLIPKVTNKPQKPRYRVAIMGARGSGRRTLFTQLKRLAEDGELDSEIFGSASSAEVITADLLTGSLPLIRMNCLVDAQILASKSSEKANLSLDQLHLCRRILAARSWDESVAGDISDLWADKQIKKVYQSLRQVDPSTAQTDHVYVSSSSSYFLDHVMQYAYHGYVPTVQEYLQAEKVASVFMEPKQLNQETATVDSPSSDCLKKSSRRSKSERLDFTRILSTEILCSLFSFFSKPADLAHLAQVNKTLWKVADSPFIWRNLAKQYFFPAPKQLHLAKNHFQSYWSQPLLHQPRLEEVNILTPDCGLVPATQFRVVNFGSLKGDQRRYVFSRSDDFSALVLGENILY